LSDDEIEICQREVSCRRNGVGSEEVGRIGVILCVSVLSWVGFYTRLTSDWLSLVHITRFSRQGDTIQFHPGFELPCISWNPSSGLNAFIPFILQQRKGCAIDWYACSPGKYATPKILKHKQAIAHRPTEDTCCGAFEMEQNWNSTGWQWIFKFLPAFLVNSLLSLRRNWVVCKLVEITSFLWNGMCQKDSTFFLW